MAAQDSAQHHDTGIHADRVALLRTNLARIESRFEAGIGASIEDWLERHDRLPVDLSSRAQHRQAVLPLTKELSSRCRGPVLLEGISPPWILEALLDTPSPPGSPCFLQRIVILQSDWFELFDGLSQTDLGDTLADPRLIWFVGDGASERLLKWFDERIDDAPPAFVVQNPSLRVQSSPDAPALFQEIERRWTENESDLIQRLEQRPPRDLEWWSKRFAGNLPEHGPMRVLLPVSRYTTYLKHIAADVQRAIHSNGMECEIIIERDDFTAMSQCAIMRMISSFDPDLIISINYPRRSLGQHIPQDIPHVCWIQDAMEHLLRPDSGKSIGERDFFVGMIIAEYKDLYGYPKDRTKWMPMIASRSKFASGHTSTQFDAEVAWVTHQSEHPDAMRDRFLREMGGPAPHLVEQLRSLFNEIEQRTKTTAMTFLFPEIHRAVNSHFFPNGVPDRAQQLKSNITYTMAVPFAERVLRHQTAEWAAEIAKRRGWRYKLYGEGWEEHPTLSEFAVGPLEHGHALREAYSKSVVQLHASINQITHQRVSECILSGGLPLCRVVRHSFVLMSMMIAVDSELIPYDNLLGDRDSEYEHWYVPLESNPAAAQYARDLTRLGLCEDNQFAKGRMYWNANQIKRAKEHLSDRITRQNAEMLGTMTDLYFTTPELLESLIEQTIENPEWRNERVKRAMNALPAVMTAEGFIGEVVEMIGTYLSNQCQACSSA